MRNRGLTQALTLGLILFGILLIAVDVLAQSPSISSATGTFEDGMNITISGSNFLTESGVPFKYDDFDSGTEGEVIGNGWYTYKAGDDAFLPTYSSDNARTIGSLASKQGKAGNSTLRADGFLMDNDDEFYVSGWFWGHKVGNYHSFKFFWAGCDWTGDIYPYMRTGFDHTNYYKAGGQDCSDAEQFGFNIDSGIPFEKGWVRLEFHGKFGANDFFNVYEDGVDVKGSGQVNGDMYLDGCQLEGEPTEASHIYFSSFAGTAYPYATPGVEGWWYWDEIYISRSEARVELGNASTWAACTHKEIQIPTEWSSSTIKADLNTGALDNAGTAWLYVFNGDGLVNTNGYEITINSTVDDKPGWQSANAVRVVPNDFYYNFNMKANKPDLGNGPEADGTEWERVLSTPADPFWYLGDDYFNCERAWAITTGSDDVVVGIIDNEVDLLHYDLYENRWWNGREVNGFPGVDDDGNGFVDDYSGWDFVEWDNNPARMVWDGSYGISEHGTQMISLGLMQGNNEPWTETYDTPNMNARRGGGVGVAWDGSIVPLAAVSGSNLRGHPPSRKTAVGDTNYAGNLMDNDHHMALAHEAVEYLVELKESGVNVVAVNMSFTCAQQASIDLLIDAGILPVSGSGNGYTNLVADCTANTLNATCRDDRVLCPGGVRETYLIPDDYPGGAGTEGPSFGPEVDIQGYVSPSPNTTYDFRSWSSSSTSYWRTDFSAMAFFAAGWFQVAPWNLNGGATGAQVIGGFAQYMWAGNWTADTWEYSFGGGQVNTNGTEDIDFFGTRRYGIFPTDSRTSGATSQLVGLAVLVNSAFPGLDPGQVKGMIERGSIDVEPYNVDNCPDYSLGDCTGQIGVGRADAYRTLTLWGTVPNDTTFTGDVYVSGDVYIPAGVTVTCAPGTRFLIAPDDLYEGDVVGEGDACQSIYDISYAGLDNEDPTPPDIPMVEIYVAGEFDISGVTLESWCNTQTSDDWNGIWEQLGGTVTTNGSTQIHNTASGLQ